MALYVPPTGVGQIIHLAGAIVSKILALFVR